MAFYQKHGKKEFNLPLHKFCMQLFHILDLMSL